VTLKIRLATQDDLPKLRLLVKYACEELEKNFGTPRMDDAFYDLLEQGIAAGEAVVVAEQQGDVIGWCCRVHRDGTPEGQVEGGTWVWKPFRKEHVARDMRRFADEHAKAKGHTYVIGTAAKSNEAGIKSCLAEGFEIVAVEQLGDEIVGIQLRKDL